MPSYADLPTPPARIPIFYPPVPPSPGEGIDRLGALQQPGWDAPPELAAVVGEPFYPQLGSLIAEERITPAHRARLAEYLARRTTYIDQLRRALSGRTPTDLPPVAEADALETLAEELRAFFAVEDLDWGRHRLWRVDEKDEDTSPAARRFREIQYLRAAVYYTAGLAPAQGRLLADYVARLASTSAGASDLPPPKIEPGGTLGFLPEGSWIRLAVPLPGELRAAANTFAGAKHALQREIVTVLLDADGARPADRRRALADLARRQAPAISALHQRAEELRLALAALPAPPASTLPAEIGRLSQELRNARAAAQDELGRQLQATRALVCRYRPGAEDLVWTTNFLPGSSVVVGSIQHRFGLGGEALVTETPLQTQRYAKQRSALEAVVKHFTRESSAAQQTIERLRGDIFAAAFQAVFPGRIEGAVTAADLARVTQMLHAAEIAARLPRYADYITATQRPGLAPAQRRLLFAAALRDLALPLPTGVRRPVFLYDAP